MDFEATSIEVPLERNEQGVIRIKGTRVSLDSFLYWFKLGSLPEEIIQKFPSVSLAAAYAVTTYYLQNRAEMDDYLEESERISAEIERQIDQRYDQAMMRERLLARAKALAEQEPS